MTTTDKQLTIGSVFSGIGAMDLACERHFKARTAWFCEREPAAQKVLAARWPGVPIYDDVTTLADQGARAVDVLIGGPPCVDLSYAGSRAGLSAERSGLFFDFVAVAAAMSPQPRWIVIENVPALLSEYRGVVEAELASCGAGYGVTWAKVAAAHVPGCPHLRKRVFVLAELGGAHRGVCDAGQVPDISTWPTPAASVSITDGESADSWNARYKRNGKGLGTTFSIGTAARMKAGARIDDADRWPTPRSGGSGGVPGSRAPGTGGKVLGEMVRTGAGMWLTPNAGNFNDGQSWEVFHARDAALRKKGQQASVPIAMAVKPPPERWHTPTTVGAKARSAARSEERLLNGAAPPSRWPTPKGTDHKAGGYQRDPSGRVWPTLTGAVGAAPVAPESNSRSPESNSKSAPQNWPTPAARDYKDGSYTPNVSLDTLGRAATAPEGADANRARQKAAEAGQQQAGARLNPAWVEVLQGLPPGWTDPEDQRNAWLHFYAQHLMAMPRWPAPMVKGMWGDSPQYAHEPPRTITGKSPGRTARLKALGNCLPPQQYLLALQLLAEGPKQSSIFDLLGAP